MGYGKRSFSTRTRFYKTMKKVILISGGSCSGKTTLANAICDIVDTNNAIVISQDNYFIDYSNFTEKELEQENFDIPSAFRLNDLAKDVESIICNNETQLPIYDFKYRKVQNYKSANLSAKYIIIEGIMGFQCQYLNEIADLKIFVDTDMDIMLVRRLKRDGKERFFDFESTLNRYVQFVREGYKKYILPRKELADIVIEGNQSFIKTEIEKHLCNILER